MTAADVDALIAQARAALQGVTEGPWEAIQPEKGSWWWVWQSSKLPYYGGVLQLDQDYIAEGNVAVPGAIGESNITDGQDTVQEQRDALFIAAARELVPALLAALKTARVEAESWRQSDGSWKHLTAELGEARAEAARNLTWWQEAADEEQRLRGLLGEAQRTITDTWAAIDAEPQPVTGDAALPAVVDAIYGEGNYLREEVERLLGVVNGYRAVGRSGPFNKKRALGRHANLMHAENAALRAALDDLAYWSSARGYEVPPAVLALLGPADPNQNTEPPE